MSENLSVEEILKQAQAVLESIDKKSEAAKAEIKELEEPLEGSVKEYKPHTAGHGSEPEKNFPEASEAERQSEEVRRYGRSNASDGKTRAVLIDGDAVRGGADGKTRPVKVSEKTSVIPGGGKGAKSFFKKTVDTVYGKKPPQTIEKSATIRSKSRFDKTSDLQEIPTILAVEELDKTRISLSDDTARFSYRRDDSEPEYDSSDQFRLEGFDDEVDEVPTIDEELAEEMLRKRREDKINKFRLFAAEEVEGDKKSEAKKIKFDDYKNRSERTQTLERLFKKKASVQVRLSITVVLGLILLYMTVMQDTRFFPPFLNDTVVYYIISAVIYAVILLVNIDVFIHGFNLRRGIGFDFSIAVASFAALGHTVALALNPDLIFQGGALYPSAAVLGLFMSGLGKRCMLMRVIRNFEFLTDNEEKSTIEDMVNEVDAEIISKNLLGSDPYIKYSVKTDFPTSFLEISFASEPADKLSKALSPIMLVLNGILFAAVGIVFNNWLMAVNILVAGLIISSPVAALYTTNSSLLGISKLLEKRHAMVCGFEGANFVHNSNAIVMEASDLFGARSCDMHGIKTFNGAKIDDAILQTAAVIIKTKSPLAHVFDDVIVGRQSILPEAEDVIYEDRMGTSAWIYQKKILVGNRDLLIQHGVTVPKIEFENKYTQKGRKALYLAIAGKISAMFIVSYSADANLKKALKKLEKSGITIILRSSDPYINEESIRNIFDLPEGFIRVMTASNGRTFEKYSEAVVEKSPAYAVHNGSALAFISSVLGADKLINVQKCIAFLAYFGAALGFVSVALLGFINGMSQLNAENVIIFQLFWSIILVVFSKIRRNGV